MNIRDLSVEPREALGQGGGRAASAGRASSRPSSTAAGAPR